MVWLRGGLGCGWSAVIVWMVISVTRVGCSGCMFGHGTDCDEMDVMMERERW